MTLGLSISGAVFVNTAVGGLSHALPSVSQEDITQLIAGASNHIIGTLSPAMRNIALDIIVASWQKTFICVYVGAAVSLTVAVFMKASS